MSDLDHTHFWFDGAALASDGRELTLDYSDPDQGGTRLCFRYIISLRTSPRLITGYTHEKSRSEYVINYDQIPHDIFRDAHDWLKSNVEITRTSGKEKLSQILMEYLESLRQHKIGRPEDNE